MTARKVPTDADRKLLEDLRDTLLAAIADARTADADKQGQVASLSKELRAIRAELKSLPAAAKSTTDELRDRRARRLTGAQVPARPARKVVSGTRSGGTGGKRGTGAGPVAKPRARGGTGRSA